MLFSNLANLKLVPVILLVALSPLIFSHALAALDLETEDDALVGGDLNVTGNIWLTGNINTTGGCVGCNNTADLENSNIRDLGDVTDSQCADGEVYEFQASNSTWICTASAGGGDSLGNHTATQNLNMSGNSIINATIVCDGSTNDCDLPPYTAYFVLEQVGTSTTWNLVNTTSGTITASTNEDSLLESAISSVCARNGGKIVIRVHSTIFTTDGINITCDNIEIEGEMAGGINNAENDAVQITSGGTNDVNIFELNGNSINLKNFMLHGTGSNTTGIYFVGESERSRLENVAIRSVTNGVIMNATTGLIYNNIFDNILIANTDNGMIFDSTSQATGDSIASTSNTVYKVFMTGLRGGIGIDLQNKADGNNFLEAHITSPTVAGFIGVRSCQDPDNLDTHGCRAVAKAHFDSLTLAFSDASDIGIQTWWDPAQNRGYPILVDRLNLQGAATTSPIQVNGNSSRPVINQIDIENYNMRGSYLESLIITGLNGSLPTVSTFGANGTVGMPYAETCTDATMSSVNGAIGIDSDDTEFCFQAGGTWRTTANNPATENLDMNSNKITDLANGTASQDAVTFSQFSQAWPPQIAMTTNNDTSTNLSAGNVTVPLTGNVHFMDSSFSVNGDGIQCNFAGRVKVTASLLVAVSELRTSLELHPQINGTDIGPVGDIYMRNDGVITNAGGEITAIGTCFDGAVITLVTDRDGTAGSHNMYSNNTSTLIVERLS